MNSTNGEESYAADYSQTHAEDTNSEVFYQLIQANITEDVATQVNDLVANGVLAAGDITERVQAELLNLPVELMNSITNELTTSDVSNLKNKAAYLIGLIKTQRKKMPGFTSAESSTSLSAATSNADTSSIDINQLPITYGKHYKGAGLGPNVNAEAVKKLLLRTGYAMDLSPGQRQYGPPPNWTGGKPGKGCEVFIGGLLRETFEDTLVPLLEDCGMIYELRIMTNPTDGINKGFAFCIFSNKSEAQSCVNQLNGKAMGRSRFLKVNVHNPNTRLFVGGVDKSKSKEIIFQTISGITPGLTDVILKGDTENPRNKHRGFVFLDYEEHKLASSAIKKLMLPQTLIFGKNLFADWAEPMADVSDEVMATVKVLYVKGLTTSVTEEVLKDRFSPYGAIDSVKKLKDYAFVHFQSREDALQAMNDLNGMRVEDATLEVTLAKPNAKKKEPKMPVSAGAMRGRGGPPMRGHVPPLLAQSVSGRGEFSSPVRGGFGGRGTPRGAPRGGRGAGGGFDSPRGGGFGRGGSSMSRGGSSMSRGGSSMSRGGSSMSRGGSSMSRGGSSMSRGGSGMSRGGSSVSHGSGLARGGGMHREISGVSRGGARGAPRGRVAAPRPAPGGYSRVASYDYGHTSSYPSSSLYGDSYGALPSLGTRSPRTSSLAYSHYDSASGYRSLPAPRPPVKRSVPAYSAYDAYEGVAAKKPREEYDVWATGAFTQQPLSAHSAYGVKPSAASAWYTDSYP